jgi:formyltetrahydrofolate deformylase
MPTPTATLLVWCPDQRGLVARLGNFVYENNGNIIHADHHTDFVNQLFLSRIEWEMDGFRLRREEIGPAFAALAESLQAHWHLHFSDTIARLAIWVSRQDHCLLDLLWRQQAGELPCTIPLILSNHSALLKVAEQFGVDFHHLPITSENKAEQEERQLQLLEQYRIDLVVLAKYMRILSASFLERSPAVINIHHSFLPAFAGANPYQRAYDRGVKIIGATAHYATAALDEGPIIEQEVVRVSHRDSVADMVRKGKDLERFVLARAVRLHLRNRVLEYGNRTVVFD